MSAVHKHLLAFAFGVIAAGLSGSDFALVRNNQPQCFILLPADASKNIVTAVGHFNETLKTITGTQLPTVHKEAHGNRIVLDVKPVKSLKTADNFTIVFPDRRTMKIEGTEYSIQWAFNHIIREFAKAEWLMPESCGLSYTPMKDLVIPPKKIKINNVSWPISRTHSTHAAWWMSNMRRGLSCDHDLVLHAFPLDKYGKDNSWPKAIMPIRNGKKITALPNPKRPRNYWQPCYSNPETAKIAVENLLEYLHKHPETVGLSLGVNDNSGFCECTECLKLDKNRGSGRSESYFTFINRVMKEICNQYPNLTVSVLAYGETFQPPTFKIHPNVLVYLTIDFNGGVLPRVRERQKKNIAEWSKKASSLAIWDYSWGYPYPVPRLYLPLHLEMLKYVYEHNGKAYYGESWTVDANEGPKQYLIAKLLWNNSLDIKKAEEEWYVRCVGKKAAPYLKAYYKIWNGYFTGRAKLTPWFKSAPAVYMTYNDVSCIYALRESDIQAAERAMKLVVALAETNQEKLRAEVMMRHWRLNLTRLRLLGAGIYDSIGRIQSEEQACKLLETVLQSPGLLKEYETISNQLTKEKTIRGYYLSRAYMRSGGTPVGRNFTANLNGHIMAAAEFSRKPEVRKLMERIYADPRQTWQTRALCRLLSSPDSYKNCLPDGNAEKGVTAQFSAYNRDTRAVVNLSTSEQYAASGKKSFRININYHDLVFQVAASGLKPGKKYVFSFKSFIAKPSGEGYLQAWCIGSKAATYESSRGLTPLKLSGGVWQNFVVLSPVLTSDQLYIRIYLRNYSKNDKVYFDDLKLIELEDDRHAAQTKIQISIQRVLQIEKPADLNYGKCVSPGDDVLQLTGAGKFFSTKSVVLDPAKKYRLSGEFRHKSGSPVQVLTGYVPLDERNRIIYPQYVYPIADTATEIVRAEKGSKVITVKDASKWKADTTYRFMVVNAKDDYSDLPNRAVFPMEKDGVKQSGDVWEITLKRPLTRVIPAGTKIREQTDGATHIWNGGLVKLKDRWSKVNGLLTGQSRFGNVNNRLWPGTKTVKLVIQLLGKADSVTEIRNVKVEEIEK